MKKLIAILAVVVSAGAFAQDNSAQQMNQGSAEMNKSSMMSKMDQINNLTEVQQEEFNEIKTAQMLKKKIIMLDIQEVNIQIQREQLAEKPNKKKIGKLIDKKSKLQAQSQKDLLKFKIDVKEKFGIEMMMGDKNCKSMMANMKDMKGMKSENMMENMKNLDSNEIKNVKNG